MKLIKLLTCCLLFFTLASCRKEEFMPEVEGQPVPHEDITITLKEVLAAAPYALFKAAWQRSNMDRILKEKGNRVPFTLLVPSDAAFIADGLSLDVINNTEPALLDSILLYHTLSGSIDPEVLKGRDESFKGRSLLENRYLRVKPALSGVTPFDPYFYLQYLKITDAALFINGKNAGTATPVMAKDGCLWPVDHVLHKPTKTILQVLEDDGRFGMYLEMNERADALYAEVSFGAFPHTFTDGLTLAPDYSNYNVLSFNSVFAIPDEVFRKAGYQTVDDILALNDRNPLPYLDWDTFTMVGGLATDTLVAYHRWGVMFSYNDPSYGRAQENPTNFYANDLNNTLLSDYVLVNSGLSGTTPLYMNPLEFGKEGSVITVKVKGSNHPAAKIVESDINTIMGPIHVVDQLIVPKDFKF